MGIVEEFSPRLIRGWVVVRRQAAPTRVDLYLDDLLLASTYATPMRRCPVWTACCEEAAPPTGPPWRPRWCTPGRPSPCPARRTTGVTAVVQIRTFSFRVGGIWRFVNRKTKISVRVGAHWLPISGHGTFLTPPQRGKRSMTELRELIGSGHVLSQEGKIQLSKKLDTQWQAQVMGLYDRLRTVFADEFGLDLFFVYGTLLGAVREGGVIGHDVDFDSAYVSAEHSGSAAVQEVVAIALRLVELGFDVVLPPRGAPRLRSPRAGRAGGRLPHVVRLRRGAALPLRRGRDLGGDPGRVGRDPGDRVRRRSRSRAGGSRAAGGLPLRRRLATAQAGVQLAPRAHRRRGGRPRPRRCRDQGVLGELLRPPHLHAGSSFFEFIDSLPDTPGTVVDIGCGDGRDALAFGTAGRHVLGLDQSPSGSTTPPLVR